MYMSCVFVPPEDECLAGAAAAGDHVQLLPGAEPRHRPPAHVLRPLQSPGQPGGREPHGAAQQAGVDVRRRGTCAHIGVRRHLATGACCPSEILTHTHCTRWHTRTPWSTHTHTHTGVGLGDMDQN